MLLFTLIGAPDTCPEVLVPVCTELAAGRRLEAAELAARLARDASVAPQDRRFAASLAAGTWIREGSPASRCEAQSLLAAYFADPALPRTSALERHHREVEADKCEKSGAPGSTTSPAASPPPAPPTPALEARSSPAIGTPRWSTPADRPVKTRLVAGRALLGTGVGLAAATVISLSVMSYHLMAAEAITTRVLVEERRMTEQEELEFRRVYGIAEQAKWVALGAGIAGTVTLAAGIPLLMSAKRRARLSPYVRGGAAGVIFSGAF
ncbi:hypothetical protein [Nannocystis punicea]|uniref:Uncharacterized protein n=1 Tax=Nannocystis punicea TaxID=2995304 RepID=A0ABY7GZQ8_9BACT|nr:hypothetical protein [Nannocystis poenicansa]WAS92468.1 hypothetical protein O0S08_40330 [Nannocystis poenicansa]